MEEEIPQAQFKPQRHKDTRQGEPEHHGERMHAADLERRLRAIESAIGFVSSTPAAEEGRDAKEKKGQVTRKAKTIVPLLADKRKDMEALIKKTYKMCPSTVVDLSHCQLLRLPNALCRSFTNVRSLRLDANKLATIPRAIRHLSNLTDLSVQENYLNFLPASLWGLKRLKVLNMQDNQLQWLSPSIGRLVNLESLNLQGNSLRNLPCSVRELGSLQQLTMSQNPHLFFPNPSTPSEPQEIAKTLREAQTAYLALRESCSQAAMEVAKVGETLQLPRILEHILLSQVGCDTEVIGRNGVVGAHRGILQAICPSLVVIDLTVSGSIGSPKDAWGEKSCLTGSQRVITAVRFQVQALQDAKMETLVHLLMWIYTGALTHAAVKGQDAADSSNPGFTEKILGGVLRVGEWTALAAHELGALATRLGLLDLASVCRNRYSSDYLPFSRVYARSNEIINTGVDDPALRLETATQSAKPVNDPRLYDLLLDPPAVTSDVMCQTADGTLYAYSHLLAYSSPVFASIVAARWSQGQTDTNPVILNLQSLSTPISRSNLLLLFKVALGSKVTVNEEKRLSVPSLVQMLSATRLLLFNNETTEWVEEQLISKLCIDNVAAILEAAVQWELETNCQKANAPSLHETELESSTGWQLKRVASDPKGLKEVSCVKRCLDLAVANFNRVSTSESYKGISQETKRMISEHALAKGLSVPAEHVNA